MTRSVPLYAWNSASTYTSVAPQEGGAEYGGDELQQVGQQDVCFVQGQFLSIVHNLPVAVGAVLVVTPQLQVPPAQVESPFVSEGIRGPADPLGVGPGQREEEGHHAAHLSRPLGRKESPT
eukprot:CAMPEP_0173183028 /NCGR_PEP_ID=MMETSP1141-20130122/8171_1 /TAXON_ID=483371 /ORGANISM="non described non described, Strain CCMP2298" /LENGTH=120 /DNA_ID=CAMNT_0014106199 /DNA_START=482 /DNA_END=843 /DNA_ORIENTATION=+